MGEMYFKFIWKTLSSLYDGPKNSDTLKNFAFRHVSFVKQELANSQNDESNSISYQIIEPIDAVTCVFSQSHFWFGTQKYQLEAGALQISAIASKARLTRKACFTLLCIKTLLRI